MNNVFAKERLPKSQGEDKTINKKHTIMIVDDEEHMLTSLSSIFNEDYKVITAGNGHKALDLIKTMEHPEKISVIISDQRMPELSGIQLFEKLKDEIPNTIRIILTGYDDKEDIIAAINKAKIHEFILKTFDPEDLKLRVKRAVEAFDRQQELIIYRRALEEKNQELSQKNKELDEANKKLIELSLTDPLTRLRNNRYLEEFISIDVSRVQRNYDEWLRDTTKVAPLESNLLFIMLDIDKLKELNDTYGHDAGDRVLIQLAEIFNKECHKSDVLIRKGGDEFLIVRRTADRNQIHDLPEKLRREVEKKTFETGDGKRIKLTCSIGFACYPFIPSEPKKIGWNEVFKIADKALYAAKYSGRNSWVGLMSTDKTKTDYLYQRIQKEMNTLITNGELKILTSIPCKNSIIWTK